MKVSWIVTLLILGFVVSSCAFKDEAGKKRDVGGNRSETQASTPRTKLLITNEDELLEVSFSDFQQEQTIRIITPPQKGGLDCANFDGVCTYTPYENVFGDDFFEFELLSDDKIISKGGKNIRILPVDDPPNPQSEILSYETKEDTPIEITFKSYGDVDTEETDLLIEYPQELGSGTIKDCQEHTCMFYPSPNFYGQETISYTVSDKMNMPVKMNLVIKVTPVNDPPIIGDDHFLQYTMHAGEEIQITIPSGRDVDSKTEVRIIAMPPVNVGTLQKLSPGSFNYSFKAHVYFNGVYKINYVLTDGELDSEVGEIQITVNQGIDSDFDQIPDVIEEQIDTDPFVANVPQVLLQDFSVVELGVDYSKDSVVKNEYFQKNYAANRTPLYHYLLKEVKKKIQGEFEATPWVYDSRYEDLLYLYDNDEVESLYHYNRIKGLLNSGFEAKESSGKLLGRFNIFAMGDQDLETISGIKYGVYDPESFLPVLKDEVRGNQGDDLVLNFTGTQTSEKHGVSFNQYNIQETFVENVLLKKEGLFVKIEDFKYQLSSGRTYFRSHVLDKASKELARIIVVREGKVDIDYVFPGKFISFEDYLGYKYGQDEQNIIIQASEDKKEIINLDGLENQLLKNPVSRALPFEQITKNTWVILTTKNSLSSDSLEGGQTYVVLYDSGLKILKAQSKEKSLVGSKSITTKSNAPFEVELKKINYLEDIVLEFDKVDLVETIQNAKNYKLDTYDKVSNACTQCIRIQVDHRYNFSHNGATDEKPYVESTYLLPWDQYENCNMAIDAPELIKYYHQSGGRGIRTLHLKLQENHREEWIKASNYWGGVNFFPYNKEGRGKYHYPWGLSDALRKKLNGKKYRYQFSFCLKKGEATARRIKCNAEKRSFLQKKSTLDQLPSHETIYLKLGSKEVDPKYYKLSYIPSEKKSYVHISLPEEELQSDQKLILGFKKSLKTKTYYTGLYRDPKCKRPYTFWPSSLPHPRDNKSEDVSPIYSLNLQIYSKQY